jgi:integrase
VDLDHKVAYISWQLQYIAGELVLCPLKTEASRRVLALDANTVQILRLHRRQAQQDYCLIPSGYVFTAADGGPLSPEYLTRTFGKLIKETGLPPVRLHDLRHGAASLALAAGADLKVIADQLGHCSIVLTADTYISVATELGLAAAEGVARLILRAGKRPPGGKMPRRADARPLAVIAA